MRNKLLAVLLGGVVAGPTFGVACAAEPGAQSGQQPATEARTNAQNSDDLQDALENVKEAVTVVRKMEGQQDARQLLQRAKGVLIVPDYGRGAAVVGGSGGSGLLVVKHDGSWSDPVFYNLGSISVGAQAGVSAGQVAFLLMTDKAVNSFKGENNFSLNADAGLTIVNYSARGQASLGKGDIVFWSDTEGGYAGVSVSGSDITVDNDANQAYYARSSVEPAAVLNGTITKTRPEASELKDALPAA